MEQSRDCFEVNEVEQALCYRFAFRNEELDRLVTEVSQHLGADADNPSCRLLIRSDAEIVGTRYAFIKRENEELKSKLETAYLTVRQAYETGLSVRTERPVPQPLKWFEIEDENWVAMLPVVLAHRGNQNAYQLLISCLSVNAYQLMLISYIFPEKTTIKPINISGWRLILLKTKPTD